jgi:hypothetical protein
MDILEVNNKNDQFITKDDNSTIINVKIFKIITIFFERNAVCYIIRLNLIVKFIFILNKLSFRSFCIYFLK